MDLTLLRDFPDRTVRRLLENPGNLRQMLAAAVPDLAGGFEREEFFRVMHEVAGRLNPLASRDRMRWQGLMRFILAWALQRRPPAEREALVALVQAAQEDTLRREEVRTISQTIADALREEGLHQGLEQGDLRTAREILLGLLRERFGRVPRALQQQIKATNDIERLKAAVYRVVKVDSLGGFQM